MSFLYLVVVGGMWRGHELSEKRVLSAIDLSSSLRSILILFAFSSPPFFFLTLKGEPGRNGNPGEVGFAGSPVS